MNEDQKGSDVKPKKKIPKSHFEFYRGYYCAVAVHCRQHGESTYVEDMLRENLLTIEEMERVGIDKYDIDILIPSIKEIERRKNIKH